METIAILGAGELGATVARCLADRDTAGRIVLVDSDLGKARGKALDIRQAGPVEGSDTPVEGAASLAEAGAAAVVVIADASGLGAWETGGPVVGDFVRSLAPQIGKAVVVVARADAPALLEAAVRRGLSRERVLGSAPVACAAALRRRLASEAKTEPGQVAAAVLGLPPEILVLPRDSATAAGVSIDRLAASATRRAVEALRGRALGPAALAAATAHVVEALARTRPTLLPLFAVLEGEYGHRGVALAVPARIARGGLVEVVELPLDPVDRVAFDGAAQRRLEAPREAR